VIVIDVGCARIGGDYSIERLLEEFHPELLIGLDPHPSVENSLTVQDGGWVAIYNAAAWTHDGTVGYTEAGLRSAVANRQNVEQVPCIDLARLIFDLPEKEDVVLKMDAEGAEYELLPYLRERGADERLRLAWVEWHGDDLRRAEIEGMLRCEVREWQW
jgi:FkbM family methyltransferase